MKLTKREASMLILLGSVLVLAIVWTFVLNPLFTGLDTRRAQLDELEMSELELRNSIALADSARAQLSEQEQLAEENYNEFYATLNSYTIDNIVNSLLRENELEVESLSISPYESVSDGELFGMEEDSEAEAPSGHLMKSTVRLQAGGAYEDILSFVDAMNDKSFCLRVSELSVQFSAENSRLGYEARLVCTIDIYGIEKPDGLEAA